MSLSPPVPEGRTSDKMNVAPIKSFYKLISREAFRTRKSKPKAAALHLERVLRLTFWLLNPSASSV